MTWKTRKLYNCPSLPRYKRPLPAWKVRLLRTCNGSRRRSRLVMTSSFGSNPPQVGYCLIIRTSFLPHRSVPIITPKATRQRGCTKMRVGATASSSSPSSTRRLRNLPMRTTSDMQFCAYCTGHGCESMVQLVAHGDSTVTKTGRQATTDQQRTTPHNGKVCRV